MAWATQVLELRKASIALGLDFQRGHRQDVLVRQQEQDSQRGSQWQTLKAVATLQASVRALLASHSCRSGATFSHQVVRAVQVG